MRNIFAITLVVSLFVVWPFLAFSQEVTEVISAREGITIEKLARESGDKISTDEFDQEVVIEEDDAALAAGKPGEKPLKKVVSKQIVIKLRPVANGTQLGSNDHLNFHLKSFIRNYENSRPLVYLPQSKEWFTYLRSDEDFSLIVKRRVIDDKLQLKEADSAIKPVPGKPLPLPKPITPPNYKVYGTWGRSENSGTLTVDFRGKQNFTQSMIEFKEFNYSELPKVTVFVLHAHDYSPVVDAQLVVTPKGRHNQRLIFRRTNKYGIAGFRGPMGAKLSLLVPGGKTDVEINKKENYALILVSPSGVNPPPATQPIRISNDDPDYAR